MALPLRAGDLLRGLPHRQQGFTYIGLLLMVVIAGLMLTMASQVWSTTAQRERESELLFIGHAYRTAIASYFALGHRYPASLQELVEDQRFPIPKRHLRRLYADPMTGQTDWKLIMTPDGQGVMGVASSSRATPLKIDGFEPIDQAFSHGDCYCSWQFIYFANRFNRWMPNSNTSNGQNQDLNTLGTFKPGSINSLPSGSGSLTPHNFGNGSSNVPPDNSSSGSSDSTTDPN